VTEHVAGSAAALRGLGHAVWIVTAGPPRAGEPPEVVRVGRRVTIPWKGASASLTYGRRLAGRLALLFRRLRLDLVHVHAPLAPVLPIAAVLAARRCGIPSVGTFHAAADSDLPYRLLNALLRRVVEKLDLRLAVSDPARTLVSCYFPGAYEIVPNGVDVERFAPGVPPAPLAPGGATIAFVGRLDPRKGLEALIDAVPLVAARVPDARLAVVGDGPLRRALEARARRRAPGRVTFTGSVPTPTLAGYYTAADVVCCPATHNESFGLVILEAMACGRAVVATNIPGYRVLVRDRITGLQVPPNDPSALAAALAEVLLAPELARRLGEAGRQVALNYSWKLVGEALHARYEALLARRSASPPGGRPAPVGRPVGL
jgi:phosphatidylinositol alpha-mannosyltransferase